MPLQKKGKEKEKATKNQKEGQKVPKVSKELKLLREKTPSKMKKYRKN